MVDDEELDNTRLQATTPSGLILNVRLYSHIVDNLWQGGCPRGRVPPAFSYVVCLYPWEPYIIPDTTVYVQAAMQDNHDVPNAKQLHALATIVNLFCAQGKTLVHCHMGINRSGLVSALALMQRGMSAHDAIELLRTKRDRDVLSNSTFEQWLRGQENGAQINRHTW